MRRQLPHKRKLAWGAGAAVCLLGILLFVIVDGLRPAAAGGPLAVGGAFGPSGVPFTWDTSLGEVQYRTDGGPLGVLNNTEANARVAGMFQLWEEVPTARIGFNRLGGLLPAGVFTDSNVSNTAELDAVEASCQAAAQSPIVYDANGNIFNALFGTNSGVIGFAGPCLLNSAGYILAAEAALNGAFRDGNASNGELSDNEFEAVFVHEFGHFFGLDHSQINLNCLTGLCASGSDDAFGLPTMFPFLIQGLTETPGWHPARTLSQDDIAWVSALYPQNFNANFGTLSGTVFFSDGVTPAQGVNVVARQVDNGSTPQNESRRLAVSVVSGYRFAGNPGQNVTGTNTGGSPFGSRNSQLIGTFDIPVPPGTYTVEVESVYFAFEGGSSVGPLDLPVPNPGADEFWDLGESASDTPGASSPVTVSAGQSVSDLNLILNGTSPRFDQFESARLWLPESLRHALGKGLAAVHRVLVG